MSGGLTTAKPSRRYLAVLSITLIFLLFQHIVLAQEITVRSSLVVRTVSEGDEIRIDSYLVRILDVGRDGVRISVLRGPYEIFSGKARYGEDLDLGELRLRFLNFLGSPVIIARLQTPPPAEQRRETEERGSAVIPERYPILPKYLSISLLISSILLLLYFSYRVLSDVLPRRTETMRIENPRVAESIDPVEDLLARAEEKLEAGDLEGALGIATRALHEVLRRRYGVKEFCTEPLLLELARSNPELAERLRDKLELVDAVLYGRRKCDERDIRSMIDLVRNLEREEMGGSLA